MAKFSDHRRKSIVYTRLFDICCFLLVVFVVSVVSLYFTNKNFAIELRQVRQPKPNLFCVGIDVSQTIKPDVLADFKKVLISRLENFIGERKVCYHISIFGLPGCGSEAIEDIVSTQSPEDPVSFRRIVEERLNNISIARRLREDVDKTPLTTPLFLFLEKTLKERVGTRVIILSDLVNDDSGCGAQYPFPQKAILKFGANTQSQIIFLYTAPYVPYYNPELNKRLMEEQRHFIMEMQRLSTKGKVRAFFYRIPDHPQARTIFLSSHLKKSIPSTIFEIIWERVSKMFDTIIGAVRG
jgi:hypothetical protein